MMEYKQLGKTFDRVSSIGQGTMGIGGYFTKDLTRDDFYVDMLRLGIDCGMTFIDTAESYGAEHSEELVGRAIKNRRKDVFIATKVSPEHLSYEDVLRSAENSLQRLQTDYIDLYQIHWPNPTISLDETFRAMKRLVKDGKVRYIGVSNFSLKQLRQANKVFFKDEIVSIQVEYNLFDRTVEEDILPYCEQEKIALIAYSPLDKGRILDTDETTSLIKKIAKRYNRRAGQIILRWLISRSPVIAIPKATNADHIKENASSTDFRLTDDDIKLIADIFSQPCLSIPTELIKVDRVGLDKFIPTPEELAKDIRNGEGIKPIRVVKIKYYIGKYKYNLVEGKLRYWAWVIACNGKVPIRALVRRNLKK